MLSLWLRTARRSNQSILKEISSGCSLEGMMLKLKLQYFGHLLWRVDSLEKTLMLGGIRGRGEGDNRGWDSWMASLTQWTWVWVNSGSWWWTGRPGVLQFMGLQRVGHDWGTEMNWTDIISKINPPITLPLSFMPLEPFLYSASWQTFLKYCMCPITKSISHYRQPPLPPIL